MMFQQAISLMDERCVSRDSSRMMAQLDHRFNTAQQQHVTYARGIIDVTSSLAVVATRDDCETPLLGVKQHSYGLNRPEMIVVHQKKPTPMEPLQVHVAEICTK